MSESSEERTKRKFLNQLKNYDWRVQVSLFGHDTPENTHELFKYAKTVLRRSSPDQPYLVRLQLKRHRDSKRLHAYLSCLTIQKLDSETVALITKTGLKVKQRVITKKKIESIGSTIKKQNPHDLSLYFGDIPVKRYTVLNAAKLEDFRLIDPDQS